MVVEVTLTRTPLQPAPNSAHALGASGGMRSDAQLVAGTLHDDALLVRLHAHGKSCCRAARSQMCCASPMKCLSQAYQLTPATPDMLSVLGKVPYLRLLLVY